MAYTTLSSVKQYLGIQSDSDNALLLSLISVAQGVIDSETHRVFEAVDATRRFDAISGVDGRDLLLDEDAVSITTVTNGDGVVIPSSEYVLLPLNETVKYAVRLRRGSSASWTFLTSPEDAIAVRGMWGFSLVPPQDIQHVTMRLVGFLYRQKDAQFAEAAGTEGSDVRVPARMPPDILMVLKRYRRVL